MSRSAPIEIAWANRKLEKSCSSDKRGRQQWGPQKWAILQRRLATLAAAPALKDMDGVPGRCHQLQADRAGRFAVYLWGSYRLVFVPGDEPLPLLDAGGLDRAHVTRIIIEEVVDYHGD
jgi:toxin HigB-1